MKVEILKTNPFIEGWRPVPQTMEVDGKKVFELTTEEYADFATNYRFYKVKSKKLFLDEDQKTKILKVEEEKLNAQRRLNLRIELCNLKEQEEKFKKHNIVTEELETKILELELKIKETGGEVYIKEESEGKDEI